MRFTSDNVVLPDDLLEALDKDALVIFAGAGVSARAYPNQKAGTYFPLFDELVRAIALDLGRTLSDEEEKQIKSGLSDRVLGEWRYDDYEVHDSAAKLLDCGESSVRIDLHRAIISLLSNARTPRLITTNFDDLFVKAITEYASKDNWSICESPALPPPMRFFGLCHLHGRVGRPADMVLTDRDIGRAYMDEGWALRFAHTIFREFNVLFIGYSLQDPPLRYLSLALEGQKPKKHWVLVDEPTDARKRATVHRDWTRRGVQPIWYHARRGDHRAIERTLRGWAEDQARTFIHRRDIAKEWAAKDPRELESHHLDRMRRFMTQPEIIRDVAKAGIHDNWFSNLIDWGVTQRVLESKGPVTVADGPLAQWIVSNLFRSPEIWLGQLQRFRLTMGLDIPFVLLHELERDDGIALPIDKVRLLLEFFRPVIERAPSGFMSVGAESLIRRLLDAKCFDDINWILELMLRPETRFYTLPGSGYYASSDDDESQHEDHPHLRTEVSFGDQSTDYSVTRIFEDMLIPNIQLCGPFIFELLTRKLRELTAVRTRLSTDFTSSLFIRAAIEHNAQDEHRHGPDHLLIDLLRDSWEAALVAYPKFAITIAERWVQDSDTAIQRVAIHAMRRLVETGHAN